MVGKSRATQASHLDSKASLSCHSWDPKVSGPFCASVFPPVRCGQWFPPGTAIPRVRRL